MHMCYCCCVLSGGDCFLLESIFEAEVWYFMCAPVSVDNEAAVCAAMIEGAREALAGYCSSIEDDLGLIRGGGLSPGSRQDLAVQVRGGGRGRQGPRVVMGCDVLCCVDGCRNYWVTGLMQQWPAVFWNLPSSTPSCSSVPVARTFSIPARDCDYLPLHCKKRICLLIFGNNNCIGLYEHLKLLFVIRNCLVDGVSHPFRSVWVRRRRLTG